MEGRGRTREKRRVNRTRDLLQRIRTMLAVMVGMGLVK
jgi:hypothetical protein